MGIRAMNQPLAKAAMPTRTLGALVLAAAGAFAADPGFQARRTFRRERLTYGVVAERVRRVASWLLARGLVPGDRIAVWSPNMPEYAVLYFGAWLVGVAVVPIDVRTRPETLDHFVAAATPRLAFRSQHLQHAFGPPVEATFDLEDLFELVAGTPLLQSLPVVEPESPAVIAYTSGTTGQPKGVILTHGNLVAELDGMQAAFPLQRGWRALSVLPLSHALELVIGLLHAYRSGVCVTYLPRLSAVAIARALREERITCLILVPELLRLLLSRIEQRAEEHGRQAHWRLAHRLAVWLPPGLRRLLFYPVHRELGGHLQFFGCGGAPLDVKLARAWERIGVRVLEGYGLTETSAASTINTWAAQQLGTAGKPIPGVEVRIADDGEILIRGPTVTPGYFQLSERTARAFIDGWFRTEDVGAFDADGFLRVTGRQASKIVLSDGRNVYPEDVERALNQHALVQESCVVGIVQDGGEAVHAVLLTAAPDRAAEIVRSTNHQLAAQQQIRGYTVWQDADFPRTAFLKIDRQQVRQAVERARAQAEILSMERPSLLPSRRAGSAPPPDHLADLVARVAQRPGGAAPDEAELEADLGLDSIGRVELLSAIEEDLGRLVDESQVTSQTTVGQLRRLIEHAAEIEGTAIPYNRWAHARWAGQLRRVLQEAAFRLQDRWMDIEVVHPERAAALPLPSVLVFNYQGPYAPLVILRALPPSVRGKVAIAVDARRWQGRDRWQGLLATLATQAFPLPKTGGALRASLTALGAYLDDGYAVVVSPEGEPERDGQLLPFQKGIGLLAVEMRVPVVPFKLEGYDRLFPSHPPFPYLPAARGPVRLIVGEPVTLPRKISYEAATERVRRALIATY
jgi:long-chain acyl-CoA synthetase